MKGGIILLFAFLIFCSSIFAYETEQWFQGWVKNVGGGVLSSGDVTLTLSLEESCVSNLVFNETFPSNISSDGIYDVVQNFTCNNYNTPHYLCTFVNSQLVSGADKFRPTNCLIHGEDLNQTGNYTLGSLVLGEDFTVGGDLDLGGAILIPAGGIDFRTASAPVGSSRLLIGIGGDVSMAGTFTNDGSIRHGGSYWLYNSISLLYPYVQMFSGGIRIFNGSLAGDSMINLTNEGDGIFTGEVIVEENFTVLGNSSFEGNATFNKDVIIEGTLFGESPVKIAGVNISNNVFSLIENLNSSSRFTLKNINSGSNATAVISAINDVGGSMSVGIGSSNFMLGGMSSSNITALFSRARGNMYFANFFKKEFVWLYNPSDDDDADNLVEVMRLNETGLNVVGNVTSENLFVPKYIFVHTNATIPVLGAGVWTNVTFDQENADVKSGISHDGMSSTNYSFTIMEDGVYYFHYDCDVEDTSDASSDINVAGRFIYINGTEILGSVHEVDIQKKGIETDLTYPFLAEMVSGDVVVFQFVADDEDVQISTHGTFGVHPESASVIIRKEANLP